MNQQHLARLVEKRGDEIDGKAPKADPLPFSPLQPNDMAHIVKRTSLAGLGCMLQLLAIACGLAGFLTAITVIGPLILWPLALVLLVAGSRKATWFECSDCGTVLAHDRLRCCPACGAHYH